MTIESDRRRKDEIRGIEDGEHNNHPRSNKFRLRTVGDHKCANEAYRTVSSISIIRMWFQSQTRLIIKSQYATGYWKNSTCKTCEGCRGKSKIKMPATRQQYCVTR
jgi:hypothetical protein